jgi:hypothetical protein
VQHPLGQVPRRGNGEVPREVEVIATDPGVGQRGEQRVVVGGSVVVRGPVPVGEELVPSLQHVPVRIPQVAQRHDVALPGGEVHGGPQDQRLPVGGHVPVGVQLRPERVTLPGRRVDDHDRCVGTLVQVDVRDVVAVVEVAGLVDPGVADRPVGGAPGLVQVQLRHVGQDRRTGGEPVVAVPLGRLDGLADAAAGAARQVHPVPRHRHRVELDPQPRVGVRVGDGERVVGERQQAQRRVQRVTPVRVEEAPRQRLRRRRPLPGRHPGEPDERRQRGDQHDPRHGRGPDNIAWTDRETDRESVGTVGSLA